MNKKEMEKRQFEKLLINRIGTFIARLICFPFVAIVHLVWSLLLWARAMGWYWLHGYESIVYDPADRKTIANIFNIMKRIEHFNPDTEIHGAEENEMKK